MAIIEDIEALEEDLLLEEQNISGELIVGASSIPGVYLLPRFVNTLKRLHSEISVEIKIADSGEIIDSVLNHDILLGFVGKKNESQAQNLQFDPFIEDELVLVAATDRKIKNELSLEELLTTPFLMRESGSGTKKNIENFFIENRLDISQLNIFAVLGSNAAIKEGVKENLGVSILSKISIRDELAGGSMKEIKIKGMRMKRMFYIINHKKRTLPKQYTVFLEQLL